jgi:hypothetical protein
MNKKEIKKWKEENPELTQRIQNNWTTDINRYNELMEKLYERINDPFTDDTAINKKVEINGLHKRIYGFSIDESIMDYTGDAEKYKVDKIIKKRISKKNE